VRNRKGAGSTANKPDQHHRLRVHRQKTVNAVTTSTPTLETPKQGQGAIIWYHALRASARTRALCLVGQTDRAITQRRFFRGWQVGLTSRPPGARDARTERETSSVGWTHPAALSPSPPPVPSHHRRAARASARSLCACEGCSQTARLIAQSA